MIKTGWLAGSGTQYFVLSTENVTRVALTALVIASLFAPAPILAEAPPDSYAAELSSLADKCEELGLKEQAALTRGWIVPRHAGRTYLFLPDADSMVAPRADAPERVKQWFEKFKSLRAEQAARLFDRAKQSAAAGRTAEAYRLLWEVLREQPNHAEARRLADFEAAPLGAAQVGRTDHLATGWSKGRHWRLDTPHFSIATNHSPKAARDLGERLEELHAIWRQLFFDFWADGSALQSRFDEGQRPLSVSRRTEKHQVVMFKNRDDYLAALGMDEPKIALTSGIYLPKKRLSVFYYDTAPKVIATWRHEAGHQLFQESVAAVADPGGRANAWILEGIAMYLESLHRQSTYYTLGGWEAERLQFARYRALANDFALPVAEMVQFNRESLQSHADIRKLYSHSAGLAQFLMDGGDGRYREIVGKYLAAIYRGEDDAGTLPKLLKSDGHTLSGIDAEYRRFLNVTDEDLTATPAPERLRTISLGRTSVTDEGLAALAGCKNLEWLDLSGTKTTDAGVAHFAGNTKLTQLFLDGVKLTDASLPIIAKFKELEELDLSNTSLTDASLGSLAGLKKLKILYLTGTNVTDKAVPVLKGLKSLEMLDLQGTKISSEASAELKRVLPKVTIQ